MAASDFWAGDIPVTQAWGVVLVGTLLAAFVFLPYCLQYREERGATPLVVLFVGVAMWVGSELIQLVTGPRPFAGGGLFLRLLGTDIVVIGVILLGLEYTGRERWINWKVLLALAVKPVIVLSIAAFRPEWLFEYPVVELSDVPWGYEIVPRPLWMAHVVYSFSAIFVGLGMLAHMMLRSNYAYRLRIFAMMFALFVPLVVNALFYLGLTPFDLTPGSFLFTAVVLMYATFRLEFMQAMPVARRTALEEMEDMVFLLDTDGTVQTVNAAVTDVFGPRESLAGLPVETFLDDETLGDPFVVEPSTTISIRVDGEKREYDVNKTVLTDYRDELLAQVLVCRDVTEKRRREEQLELLKDVQSRFLRHNLRNKLNAILAHAEFMREDRGPSPGESHEVIKKTSERLIEWGEKARTIEELVETSKRVHFEVTGELDAIVSRMQATHPDCTFETDLGGEAWVVTVPQIDSALKNLIDNAARYNTAANPCVRVATTATADRVRVTIEDNGPGIDDDEIQTIETGEETQLEHGSGLGLWLVYWVVESSGGDITFETVDGTTVVLEFERVDPPERDPTTDLPDGTDEGTS